MRAQLLRFRWKGEPSVRPDFGPPLLSPLCCSLAFSLEAPGARIDPFQIMLNAKNLPTQELEEGVHGFDADKQKCELYTSMEGFFCRPMTSRPRIRSRTSGGRRPPKYCRSTGAANSLLPPHRGG